MGSDTANDDTLFCPECGTKMSADARFCAQCGSELPSDNPSSLETQAEETGDPSTDDASEGVESAKTEVLPGIEGPDEDPEARSPDASEADRSQPVDAEPASSPNDGSAPSDGETNFCPDCEEELSAEMEFCAQCGASLPTDDASGSVESAKTELLPEIEGPDDDSEANAPKEDRADSSQPVRTEQAPSGERQAPASQSGSKLVVDSADDGSEKGSGAPTNAKTEMLPNIEGDESASEMDAAPANETDAAPPAAAQSGPVPANDQQPAAAQSGPVPANDANSPNDPQPAAAQSGPVPTNDKRSTNDPSGAVDAGAAMGDSGAGSGAAASGSRPIAAQSTDQAESDSGSGEKSFTQKFVEPVHQYFDDVEENVPEEKTTDKSFKDLLANQIFSFKMGPWDIANIGLPVFFFLVSFLADFSGFPFSTVTFRIVMVLWLVGGLIFSSPPDS